MRFNAPTQVFFMVSLVLALVALVSKLTVIRELSPNAFWILFIGYVILAIGCIYKRK